MAIVHIVPWPKKRDHGLRIEHYVAEDADDQVLGTFRTQTAAIEWAATNGHTAHVARDRYLGAPASISEEASDDGADE